MERISTLLVIHSAQRRATSFCCRRLERSTVVFDLEGFLVGLFRIQRLDELGLAKQELERINPIKLITQGFVGINRESRQIRRKGDYRSPPFRAGIPLLSPCLCYLECPISCESLFDAIKNDVVGQFGVSSLQRSVPATPMPNSGRFLPNATVFPFIPGV
jgi:hypothetical protein